MSKNIHLKINSRAHAKNLITNIRGGEEKEKLEKEWERWVLEKLRL
jgi:hypothetical protein